MSFFNRSFLLGLAAGVALTLATVNVGAIYLARKAWIIEHGGLMKAARSLAQHPLAGRPDSHERFPQPWLPTGSSLSHENWKIRPLDGNPTTLGEFRGKVVFLNFWSTSCLPCIMEMPGIANLRDSLKGEPVAFLAVTQEENEQTVRDFLRKVSLRVPVYLGDKDLPEGLLVAGVPTSFVLDRNGVAVFRHIGPANWDDNGVRALIRKLAAQ